jgi:mannosyltransferase
MVPRVPPPTAPWPRRRALAIAAGLAAIAAIVRGVARPGRPMWFDETFTLALARLPADRLLWPLTHEEANGGLYVLLVRAALRAGDAVGADDLAVARLVAAAAGVAAVPALYLACRRALGDAPAALAALLLAVSRFHVYYSVEARGYVLAVLLVVLAAGALVSLLEAPRAAPSLAFAVLAPLATWSHAFAALGLAAQGMAALLHPSVRGARGPSAARAVRAWLAVALTLGAAGSAAVLLVAVRGDAGQLAWIAPLGWGQVWMVFVFLAGHARPLLLAAVAGTASAIVLARGGAERGFGAALALAWGLLPVALAVAVSAWKPLLHPRYLIVALPGFLLLAALGLLALRRPRWVAVAVALAVALSVRELRRPRRGEPPWEPWDVVVARVVELARPGDALVVRPGVLSLTLERELRRRGRGPWPEPVEPPPGDPLGLTPRAPLEQRLADRTGVVFVLARGDDPQVAGARTALAAGTRVAADEEQAGIRILRLER